MPGAARHRGRCEACLATRYDKLATVYRAAVLNAVLAWTGIYRDTLDSPILGAAR